MMLIQVSNSLLKMCHPLLFSIIIIFVLINVQALVQCPDGEKQANATDGANNCLRTNKCPTDYQCIYSQLAMDYICCQGLCSTLGKYLMQYIVRMTFLVLSTPPLTGCPSGVARAMAKDPNNAETSDYCLKPFDCPTGYDCQFVVAYMNYLCCKSK